MTAAAPGRYLDAGESDGRGGVGADHQGNEGRPQVSEHVGELREEQKQGIRLPPPSLWGLNKQLFREGRRRRCGGSSGTGPQTLF